MKLHDHQYRCKKCQMLHPSEMDRFFKNQQLAVMYDDPEHNQVQNMVASLYMQAKVKLFFLIDLKMKPGWR